MSRADHIRCSWCWRIGCASVEHRIAYMNAMFIFAPPIDQEVPCRK